MTFKLVYFVPEEARDATRDACFAAGGGRIGAYERCSWYTPGTGTFLAGEGRSRRRRGRGGGARAGVPGGDGGAGGALEPVLAALRDAHPYEEVAFDVIPLHAP